MQAIILIAFVLVFGVIWLFRALNVASLKELLIFLPFVFAGVGLILLAGFRAVKKPSGHTAVPIQQAGLKPKPGAIAASYLWVLVLDGMGIFSFYKGITTHDPYMIATGVIFLIIGSIMTWVFVWIFVASRRSGSAQK